MSALGPGGDAYWRERLALAKDEIERKDADIERLRAELAAMADCGEHPCAFCFEMAQRAKRALEQQPAKMEN